MRIYEYAFTFALLVALAACSGDPQTGGETHWGPTYLAGCVSDAQCESPYQCVQHVCSRPCDASDDCSVEAGSFCDDDGKCIVAQRQDCTSAEQPCDATSEGWLCDAHDVDACRASVAVCRNGLWLDGVLDACRTSISEADDHTIIVRRSEAIRPVDVLMVVDNSSSMAHEQQALGAAMPAFVDTLRARGVGDLQIATTSVDAQCDTAGAPSLGRFNVTPDTVIGIVARAEVAIPCSDDSDCDATACGVLGSCTDAPDWECVHTSSCDPTSNGTTTRRCVPHCQTDSDCAAVLGVGYHCAVHAALNGCLPDVGTCPSTIAPVLSGFDLDDVACAFRVGLSQQSCLTVEQPLESMRLALDPSGPNATQSASLLRADAVLAVVVMSDEDDCSFIVAPEELDTYRCASLADDPIDGPLRPIARYTDFLRALKPPGRTFFATIAGDSTAATEPERVAERQAYADALASTVECNWSSEICQSSDRTGSAKYAGRLLATVDALAPDSRAENICGDDMSAAITRIADQLAETATRICLPRAPDSGFTVTRIIAGVETTVSAGAGAGTWHLASGAAAECDSSLAIVLSDPPVAGEALRFVYHD